MMRRSSTFSSRFLYKYNNIFFFSFHSVLFLNIQSSRYCRRSISSSCSRRSSILFQRHTVFPLDSTQLRREETFDTLCESLTETLRFSYPPLPPIATDSSSNLTQSLHIPTADVPPVSTDPPPDLAKSLAVPSTSLLPSISPPLITSEETPDIQEKKQEFTRRLLSKSLHREPSAVPPIEKTMNSPGTVHKSPAIKPVVLPRTQKPPVDNRRVNSVERHPPTTVIRHKLPTAVSSVCVNNTNHSRLGKLPMDIFQPQCKSTATTTQSTVKRPTIINTKTRCSLKSGIPKVKVTVAPSDEEASQPNK